MRTKSILKWGTKGLNHSLFSISSHQRQKTSARKLKMNPPVSVAGLYIEQNGGVEPKAETH